MSGLSYGPRGEWSCLGKRRRKLVVSIGALIDGRFASSGYRFDGSSMWLCDGRWKCGRIWLSAILANVIINLDVVIPPEPGTVFDFQALASTNLGLVAGRGSASYDYPSIFSSEANFLASIERDLDAAVGFFHELETPRSCLDRLRKDAPREPHSDESLFGFPRAYSQAYAYCERYLEGLLQSGVAS